MASGIEGKSLLTPGQVARILSVHINTVRRWSNQGMLRSYRISVRGDRRFRQEDIDEFVRGEGIMGITNLGVRLKERRKAKGWSLGQLGELSGVHMSYIGRIERGERFPSAHVLRRLAEPLGYAEVELLKLANYISQDDSDRQVERLKEGIKLALMGVIQKIDSL